MRAPTERDQRQAKLDILIEGFMRADWTAYRDAAAWLRDFAAQKNIERGRVMCGGNYWSTPQRIEAVRERARERATTAAARAGNPNDNRRGGGKKRRGIVT